MRDNYEYLIYSSSKKLIPMYMDVDAPLLSYWEMDPHQRCFQSGHWGKTGNMYSAK